MNENENTAIEEVAENVEETATEKIVESTPAQKTFTQEEVNDIVKKAKARAIEKVTRKFEKEYGELTDVLRAGSGETSVEGMTKRFRSHYESKGVEIPHKPTYSEKETAILAKAEAEEIISGGDDEVVEELGRLAQIGVDKMSARDKAVFMTLQEHRRAHERQSELTAIGAREDIYNSSEYKEFRELFKHNTPEKVIYDNFMKTQPKKEVQTFGSIKNTDSTESGLKDYYTPEEARKFTKKDFDDNPALFERVVNSSYKWNKKK